MGLYEALCGSAQGFIQDVVFRVLSARTKYNTKMTARARSLYTVPTGWDCMKGARARQPVGYEGHARARALYTVPTGWDCMKGARARSVYTVPTGRDCMKGVRALHVVTGRRTSTTTTMTESE